MLNFLKKILIIALFFFTTNLFAGVILTEDMEIKVSAKGLNLGGHTATIVESGVVLEKITNGYILVSASVGPGLITLKNCQNISVILESGVYLLLDGKTEVESLFIKENAMIDSLENFQA